MSFESLIWCTPWWWCWNLRSQWRYFCYSNLLSGALCTTYVALSQCGSGCRSQSCSWQTWTSIGIYSLPVAAKTWFFFFETFFFPFALCRCWIVLGPRYCPLNGQIWVGHWRKTFWNYWCNHTNWIESLPLEACWHWNLFDMLWRFFNLFISL